MKIIVVGDIMLDINYISFIERNSPEANIPIHNIKDVNFILGAASNVANNLKRLYIDVELISVIGCDYYGEKIKALLNENEIKHKLFMDESRKTTQKNRIFHNNEIKVRYDIEDTKDICETISDKLYKYITEIEELDAIIISDYDKGVITYNLCQKLIKYCNSKNIYTFVDPKLKNYLKYAGCFCFKPNLNESEKISNSTDIELMFKFMKENINAQHVVITSGENGIYVDNKKTHITHETPIKAVDVTGAGDIAITILTYMFIKCKDITLSCKIANYIAGKSVQVISNYKINIQEIENCYKSLYQVKLDKVIHDNEINKLENFQSKNVVFTNGCFDIVHSAHLKLLNFCREKADILIVGLNSDASIKQLKGDNRPINDLSERIEFLSNLKFIDYIVVFNELTPYNILKDIKPDIIVKGGDYTIENIVGAEFAKDIILFDYIQNKSTSLVVKKIQTLTDKKN